MFSLLFIIIVQTLALRNVYQKYNFSPRTDTLYQKDIFCFIYELDRSEEENENSGNENLGG
jgi:hypothetical protein